MILLGVVCVAFAWRGCALMDRGDWYNATGLFIAEAAFLAIRLMLTPVWPL